MIIKGAGPGVIKGVKENKIIMSHLRIVNRSLRKLRRRIHRNISSHKKEWLSEKE